MSLLIRASLLVLCVFGAHAIFGFGATNGFVDTTEAFKAKQILPNIDAHYDNKFTGIEAIDSTLSTLLTFFWPCVDGNHPDTVLVGCIFATQFVALWTVALLDSQRKANAGLVITFTTIYGLIFQVISFAVTAPAYLLLHLLVARTVSAPTAKDLEVREAALRAIPYSLTIGTIVPTILMSLPAPQVISVQTKIWAILFWQAFPLWTQIIQTVLQNTIFASNQKNTTHGTQLRLLRRTYVFGLGFASVFHAAALAVSVSAQLFPGLFSSWAQPLLVPQRILTLPNPFNTSTKVDDMGQAALYLLQWDYAVGSVAYFIWARYVRASNGKTALSRGGISDILQTALRIAIFGIGGTALTYVWERDEAVLSGAQEETERKAK